MKALLQASLPLLLVSLVPAAEETLSLVVNERPLLPIVLPENPDLASQRAAQDLAEMLHQLSGAEFTTVLEGGSNGPAIHIGPTRISRAAFGESWPSGSESWAWRVRPEGVFLAGADERGLLYSVDHWLEDSFGVRWWTPEESTVPFHIDLAARFGEKAGRPAFRYRDVFAGSFDPKFAVHMRWNGGFNEADASLGGGWRYGGPYHVHTLGSWVPVERWFETHPEWFAERSGFRVGNGTNYCLTNRGLAKELARQIREAVLDDGMKPPSVRATLYSISLRDRRGACECDVCTQVHDREGSVSGALVLLANRVAGELVDLPVEIRLDVLAYLQSIDPPKSIRPDPRIVVRFAPLQGRDVLLPLDAPGHERFLAGLTGWGTQASTARLWIYPAMFSSFDEFPTPNLRPIADDLKRAYELGYEGIFSEHPHPIGGDRRAMKLWVISKLMEDPGRPPEELVQTFAEGYYADGAKVFLRYDRQLRRAARRTPALSFDAEAEDYVYLSPRHLRRLARGLDRGIDRMASGSIHKQRLERVRLSLDRARLRLDPGLKNEARETVLKRLEEVVLREIEHRLPPSRQGRARQELVDELRQGRTRN